MAKSKKPIAEFFTKKLSADLSDNRAEQILQLNRFAVTAEGVVFRSVRYHEVSTRRLTMELVHGGPASWVLRRSGRPLASSRSRSAALKTADLAGRWLGHFHRWKSDGRVEPYDTSERLRRSIADLQSLRQLGLAPTLAQRLPDFLDKTSREQPEDVLATIHGDYKPSNLIIVNSEVVGVDMEGHHRGHPLIDVGQFLVHLFLLRSASLLGTGHTIWWRSLCGQFLAGYRRVVDWDIVGLQFRIMDAALAVLAKMGQQHRRPLWLIRGGPIMIGTLRAIIDNPIEGP